MAQGGSPVPWLQASSVDVATMTTGDFSVDPDVARAFTLPGRLYTDPGVLELERLRVFQTTWQYAGRAEQVSQPGSFFTTEIAGEPIVVVRDRDMTLRAFYNVCRHRAALVVEGAGCRSSLQCPYHGWTYGLDGRLIGAPDFDGVEGFNRRTVGLPAVAVEMWEQFVFVRVDGPRPDLATSLEDIPARAAAFALSKMSFVERREYLVACNWKAYVDNYLEGYHIPLIHPSLMRELDYAKYHTVTRARYSQQQAPIRASAQGDAGERLYSTVEDQTEALYLWIFPNLMLNIYPDNLQINLIEPVAADRTRTVFEWYLRDPSSPEVQGRIQKAIAFADEVQREDMAICERVQRGLQSRSYDRGRYSPRRENGVHHFHVLLSEALTSATR